MQITGDSNSNNYNSGIAFSADGFMSPVIHLNFIQMNE